VSELSAWERLQLARAPSRPNAALIFDEILEDAFELHGDRASDDDRAVVVRLGSLRGRRIVAVGLNRDRIKPSGFRKAIRALGLAGRLGLPVLTIIDTRGADPLPASEAGGVASAIAATFHAMLACTSPTVAVLTGEGGSGGALAMAAADRVLALENAVFSVIAPEGAAAILYRDAERAPELAERLKITAGDLHAFGLVDGLLNEDNRVWSVGIAEAIAGEFDRLVQVEPEERLLSRSKRWRSTGAEHLGQRPR
jgi:acetyl-CoA carboxylase carboxyl transferase alpha subunit